MSRFTAAMTVLPEPQRGFWPELATLPSTYVLYGGTALALRLGHRSSVDFDLFTSDELNADRLFADISWLHNAEVLQRTRDTLTVTLDRGGPIKVSIFADIGFGRVGSPDKTGDAVLNVASALDLFGTKLNVLLERIETKDYLDVNALLTSGVPLELGLGAAATLFGSQFPPVDAVKALSYLDVPELADLPAAVQMRLRDAADTWTGAVATVERSATTLC